jgi:hypothetical protein
MWLSAKFVPYAQTVMATPQQQALFRECRLALAVQAYKQGQIPILLAAFRLCRVVGCQDARGLRVSSPAPIKAEPRTKITHR